MACSKAKLKNDEAEVIQNLRVIYYVQELVC
jgi:hypothetical protein